jgi:hypothetical protein
MGLKDTDPPPRFFRGQRWINIVLRGLHLLGVAGMGAGYLVPGSEPDAWLPYLVLTLATGAGMAMLDAWSDRHWLAQLSGQTVLFKLLLLALIPFWPAAGPALFTAVILISATVSHAPARVRHYCPLKGRARKRSAATRIRKDD